MKVPKQDRRRIVESIRTEEKPPKPEAPSDRPKPTPNPPKKKSQE